MTPSILKSFTSLTLLIIAVITVLANKIVGPLDKKGKLAVQSFSNQLVVSVFNL